METTEHKPELEGLVRRIVKEELLAMVYNKAIPAQRATTPSQPTSQSGSFVFKGAVKPQDKTLKNISRAEDEEYLEIINSQPPRVTPYDPEGRFTWDLEFNDEELAKITPQGHWTGAPGGGPFIETGKHFASIFVREGGLKPTSKVLDVGCSSGRMAIPLTQYIDPDTPFEGVDVTPDTVNFCTDLISSKYPNFKFSFVDVYNGMYNSANPNEAISATDFRYPYEDETFDFIHLCSVYTHMMRPDAEAYLREFNRVLKVGGTLFITYFIINEQSKKNMIKGISERVFNVVDPDGGTYHGAGIRPEDAVGYKEDAIKEMYDETNFKIDKTLYGYWSGRSAWTSHQDIVIATKEKNI